MQEKLLMVNAFADAPPRLQCEHCNNFGPQWPLFRFVSYLNSSPEVRIHGFREYLLLKLTINPKARTQATRKKTHREVIVNYFLLRIV